MINLLILKETKEKLSEGGNEMKCNIEYEGSYFCNSCDRDGLHLGCYQFEDLITINDIFVPSFSFIVECKKCKEWVSLSVGQREEFMEGARRI